MTISSKPNVFRLFLLFHYYEKTKESWLTEYYTGQDIKPAYHFNYFYSFNQPSRLKYKAGLISMVECFYKKFIPILIYILISINKENSVI